ncbi:MAG: glycosyltransferase family 39 protein [bacterium]
MNQPQIKHNKKILIILAIFFVFVYSFLAFRAGTIFNSPDENANYFFANLFARESRLDYPLKENSDIIHPRSMAVADQKIVPQSFLGMPLIYGFLGKIFGSNAIIFFTPIIAAISVLFFYEIIKKIFDEKIAFLSSVLVFINPAFWYYSTHSMYHNVLFASLLIMGIYFFVKNNSNAQNKKQCANIILGSIFIGLSLMARYSEIPWVVLILIILYFFNKDKISKKQAIICFLILFVLSIPIFFLNNKLYGNPLSNGYSSIGKSIDTNSISASIRSSLLLNTLRVAVLNIFRNSWNYGIYLFWWLSLPTCFGIFLLLKNYKKLESKQKKYLIAFLIGSVYLILYYGSWSFHDNPDPTKITIGTSYARYWLPIYIFSMPFLSMLLLKIKQKRMAKSNAIFLCVLALLISYNVLFVFKLTDESIGRNVLGQYAEIKNAVLNLTENNSIIIAGYYDKLFFPDRLVIENIDEERDKRLNEISKLLEKKRPIYYYSWNSDQDILYLNKILNKYKLNLTNAKKIREGERLFDVVMVEKNKN